MLRVLNAAGSVRAAAAWSLTYRVACTVTNAPACRAAQHCAVYSCIPFHEACRLCCSLLAAAKKITGQLAPAAAAMHTCAVACSSSVSRGSSHSRYSSSISVTAVIMFAISTKNTTGGLHGTANQCAQLLLLPHCSTRVGRFAALHPAMRAAQTTRL